MKGTDESQQKSMASSHRGIDGQEGGEEDQLHHNNDGKGSDHNPFLRFSFQRMFSISSNLFYVCFHGS